LLYALKSQALTQAVSKRFNSNREIIPKSLCRLNLFETAATTEVMKGIAKKEILLPKGA